ncbi:M23 family metallopeptidase [Campylobacter ureolyticus]|uniref:M23 family metallopeptidase n=1 Tax=Campylobacter ureolyticus TaxID=827 RepID=UPI00215A7339|nr:M23 family metallopeptidase [Campylobacter ureolyticus]MCR8699330.1 M23 family metallopeptidase [Campylobacter ureolyticus]
MNTYISITDKNGNKKYEFSSNFFRNLKLILILNFAIFLVLILTTIFLIFSKNSVRDELINLKSQNEILENELNSQKNSEQTEEPNNLELALALSKTSLKEQKPKNISVAENLESKFIKSVPNNFPITNKGITSSYGQRVHPISKISRFHHGIDLRAELKTPIYATADGFVKYAALSNTGYGYLVIITHNYGFETRYAHMFDKDVVKVGQWVRKGELIGYSGNTGLSSGPHLHYEVRFLDHSLDPLSFIKFNNIFYDERKVPWQGILRAISEF